MTQIGFSGFHIGKSSSRSADKEYVPGPLNAARGIMIACILGIAFWAVILVWALS